MHAHMQVNMCSLHAGMVELHGSHVMVSIATVRGGPYNPASSIIDNWSMCRQFLGLECIGFNIQGIGLEHHEKWVWLDNACVQLPLL